jgi:hypothetical protein
MEDVGTRYAVLVVRVFADAFDADDIALANSFQDKVIASQRAAGEFIVPSYDGKSFDATRRIASTWFTVKGSFGSLLWWCGRG